MSLFRLYPLLFASLCCSAWAVVVSLDHNEHGKGSKSDRGFIVEGVTSAEKEREEFSSSIPCIASFLDRATDPARTSLMISADIDHAAFSLATVLQKRRFAFLRYSGDMEFDTRELASNAIVLVANATSLWDDLYVIDPCTRDCPFFVVLTHAFRHEQDFLAETDALTRSMWARRIFTVVVLARVGESVLAAGATSFLPDQPCAPSFPIVLDKCGTRSWDTRKVNPPEWNKCVLKVAYFVEPPYVTRRNETTEGLRGFEGMLTEEILKDENVEREEVAWTENATYVDQVRTILYQADADLVVGRVLLQLQEDIDYSSSYDMLKVVWLIPKVANVSLKGLIQPFHPYVWATLGCALILAVLVKIFLIPDLGYLDIFALIIGVSIANRPTKLSTKIQYISWSVFGLFLMEVYVDALADQLINTSDTKITTTEELVSSSFRIGGTNAFKSLFEDDALDETSGIVSRIREKFVTFNQNEYTGLFNDVIEGRNSSFALMILLNSSRSEDIDTLYAYTMSTDVIYSFPLAMAVWKGFPKLQRINAKIHDYIDMGIFDHMIKLAIQKGRLAMMFEFVEEEEYKTNLHLQHFAPAFLMMMIGFSVGFLSIIVEIALYPSELLFCTKRREEDNF
ncbi:uncharacterized protein LOC114577324 isoform X1 [Apis cerana]|uniref:uncharacterized protein LOC114577324 isoform X1 n=1 Tax=Apis cerana TaxID=7461 RepID=UPI002B22CD59|nr:uncharacterized protein LOC114577324 isoform X1 [Apis cerana]